MSKRRKTKKDKIIAQLRRAAKRQAQPNLSGLAKNDSLPVTSPDNHPLSPLEEKKSRPTTTNFNKISSKDIKSSQFVKKDLTKSLALAILITGLELIAYWQLG